MLAALAAGVLAGIPARAAHTATNVMVTSLAADHAQIAITVFQPGIPRVRGTLTSVGLDTRVFFSLSVGTTPADARLASNNVLPLRRLLPEVAQPMSLELPGVALDVPAGQALFLTVSPVSDMFFAHGSRAPGLILINDAVVDLPIV